MASDDNNGSVGSVKDGHAVRRSDGWESPDAFGVMPAGVIGATPRGTNGYVPIGPGTQAFNTRRGGPFTTGMQRSRSKR